MKRLYFSTPSHKLTPFPSLRSGLPPEWSEGGIKWLGRQPQESEIIFTGSISKGKRILMLKFSKFIILSPPFEGGVAAVQ